MVNLMRSKQKPGKCPVEGHGSQRNNACEVNIDFISFRDRVDDKRDIIKEIEEQLQDYVPLVHE